MKTIASASVQSPGSFIFPTSPSSSRYFDQVVLRFICHSAASMWLVLLLACSISGALSSCIDSYDYIIVGGGPGGLTVANRLSELPNVTVAVIEAGGDVSQNPNVTDPNRFTLPLNTPIDWQYTSTNQTYATGQTMGLHAGKALGGTTTVNGKYSHFAKYI